MLGLLGQNIVIAHQSIKGQLLRTILTVAIIAIGITALVGILSSVKALEATIGGGLSGIGANTFQLQRYALTLKTRDNKDNKPNPIINYREVKEFESVWDYPFSQVGISFLASSRAEVKSGAKSTKPKVIITGVNQNYIQNAGLTIAQGRGFSQFDISNNARVAVIGSDMQDDLFPDSNPIDQTISIKGNKFTIIGVLKEKGSTFGNNIDLRVLLPIDVTRSIYTLPNINYDLSIKVTDEQFIDGAQDQARLLMRNIRGLTPVETDNFGIIKSNQLLNTADDIQSILYIAAFIISGITILGSSVALMNIMLVSVTERTREIGVRKALGAKRMTISWQFFIETLLISQYGSLLGILLGLLIGYLVSTGLEVVFSMPWMPVILATIVSIVIAILSGVLPAIKASRLDPIESLRYE